MRNWRRIAAPTVRTPRLVAEKHEFGGRVPRWDSPGAGNAAGASRRSGRWCVVGQSFLDVGHLRAAARSLVAFAEEERVITRPRCAILRTPPARLRRSVSGPPGGSRSSLRAVWRYSVCYRPLFHMESLR